jgi:hypothetical protein
MLVEQINPHGMPADEVVETFHDLALFLGGSEDSWTGQLLRLIGKSDQEHQAALREAFPLTVQAFLTWRMGDGITVADLTEVCEIRLDALASAARTGF